MLFQVTTLFLPIYTRAHAYIPAQAVGGRQLSETQGVFEYLFMKTKRGKSGKTLIWSAFWTMNKKNGKELRKKAEKTLIWSEILDFVNLTKRHFVKLLFKKMYKNSSNITPPRRGPVTHADWSAKKSHNFSNSGGRKFHILADFLAIYMRVILGACNIPKTVKFSDLNGT